MIAHALTTARLLLAGPVAIGCARPDIVPAWTLLACIVTAIATDFLDGIAARHFGTASPRGRLFDHSTDFLFVTSGLFGAAAAGDVPLALPIVIVIAFAQYVIDSYLLDGRKELRMSVLGRWNGILYFVPLVLIAVARVEVRPASREIWTMLLVTSWAILLASTIASIIDRAVAPKTG